MPPAHVHHATKAREVMRVDDRLRGGAGEAHHGPVEQGLILGMRRSICPRVGAEQTAIARLPRADASERSPPPSGVSLKSRPSSSSNTPTLAKARSSR